MTLLIACSVALLTSTRAPAYSVYIAAPRLTFVPSAARLHAICGPTSLACTAIRGTTFHGTCESRDGWHARVDVSFDPYTYLWLGYLLGKDVDVLTHEREHLRDIQTDATEYVRTLSMQTFHSQIDCESAMGQNGVRFEERLRRFAARSQADRQ